MDDKALGLIETVGFIPAVESADTAVKSADVELAGLRFAGCGLVSVMVTGDVSSVKASMDAAKQAAERLGEVRSVTVIAKTGEGLETILAPTGPRETPSLSKKTHRELSPGQTTQTSTACDEISETPGTGTERSIAELKIHAAPLSKTTSAHRKQPVIDEAALHNMKVNKLRRLARNMEGLSILRKEIKFARKKELIEAIITFDTKKGS